MNHPAQEFDWNDVSELPQLESVALFGYELRRGDRVRLWPKKGADIMDLALAGKVAMIEAIEQELEGQIHIAVVLDDDPGKDLGLLRQPGHRFFFGLDEVEPMVLADNQTNRQP